VRVAANRLVEDAQVVSRGPEVALLLDRENGVRDRRRRSQPTDCGKVEPPTIRSLAEQAQARETLLWSPSINRCARGIAVDGDTSTSLPISESSMRLTPTIVVDSSTIECSTSVRSMRQSW
jgi:hypothetical protein